MDQPAQSLIRYYVYQVQALQRKVKALEDENKALVSDLNESKTRQ